MAYWIKVNYERNEYVVDLDRISAFVCTPNGRITFWLPDSSIPLIINSHNNPECYQDVVDYINQITSHSIAAYWIKILYDRSEYVIDLNRISAFCHSSSNRLTFWLAASTIPIVINKHGDPDTYQRLLDYIKQRTGHSL